jgi:DNA-binding CsgD family transcriptional regulator
MLVDRKAEKQELDGLLGAVREGFSCAVVLRGEAGIGKTALLEYALGSAAGMRIVRAVGIESEMELGFAALHQLLVPFLGRLESLPVPQREALGSAFALIDGPVPNLFLVGLAALTLLADAAARRPVLCVFDDAQWIDQASAHALGFVARRLFADRIGMLFAVRDPGEPLAALEGLTQLPVGALPEDDARELLASVAGGGLDQRAADRIVSETGGNPLALVELGGELSAGQLGGSSPLPEPLPLGRRLEERFLARVRTLPPETQTLLLLASAQQHSDPEQLWRAAASLGVGREAADLPELDRLIMFAPQVAFRHPLVRSAVYQGAAVRARRRAHDALAAACDPERDPDRRAWHLGSAAASPDEEVAAELERSAERARGRGGWASNAAFLHRAAELTPDPRFRAERELAAAKAKLMAGDPAGARTLLEAADPKLADPLARAQARRLDGAIRLGTGHLGESAAILLEAARAFEPLDTRLTRETLLEALQAVTFAGRFASGAGALDVLQAAREVPTSAESPETIVDLLLEGFADRAEGRARKAAGLFRRAIEALGRADDLRWFALGGFAAIDLLDDEADRALSHRWVRMARDQGALTSLALALAFMGSHHLRGGRFRSAAASTAEGQEISAATGDERMTGRARSADVRTLAWLGREADVRAAAAAATRDSTERRSGLGLSAINLALTVLEISLGSYEAALSSAVGSFEEDAIGVGTMVLPEIVEAGARCGDHQAAAAALDRLTERAVAGDAAFGLGLLARSRALLSDDAVAEGFYGEAISHLERCDTAPELARAHLLYGEWLRRQRRRADARDQLRTAHDMFGSMGAEAFANRARVELRATGEHPRQRTAETRDELTPQEERIALLASEGASNREIAAQLFISPSTVAYHLHKIFLKLNVRSRAQLARSMPDRAIHLPDGHGLPADGRPRTPDG